ncbi:hypothetical protein HF086_014621, partial [Spodoptera exigua]
AKRTFKLLTEKKRSSEMDGTWVLILLALVMLVGSYVAGSIPLNVSMSEL